MFNKIDIIDNDSYILCKYDTKNNITMNTCFYKNIIDTYYYIMDNYDFIKSKDFLENYDKYLLRNNVKNCNNMLFPKNYVFSFEHENNLYELFRIKIDSEYVLLIFNLETNLIESVEGFDNYENAMYEMNKKYTELFDNDINLIKHNEIPFGMIFKCIKYCS